MMLPILYSYRRCPYAMRARVALQLADITVEIREVSLRDKPAHLLQISPKGTVPVMQLADGTVIEQSLDIMLWALKEHALQTSIHAGSRALILENDTHFKQALDAYKYPERYPNQTQAQHRAAGELYLQQLEDLLHQHAFLMSDDAGFADIAIFPFVRQFAAVDVAWWQTEPYPKLAAWLTHWVESALFNSIMTKNPTYQSTDSVG
jgi:glutathione S-transferase